jgi:hypothetical protein
MNRYVLDVTPRQESCALLSLQNQDYSYNLPALQKKKVRSCTLVILAFRLFCCHLGIAPSPAFNAPPVNLLITS